MPHGADGGLSVQGIGWFLYAIFSFVIAYCAMKIAAQQRENREKFEKRRKAEEKKDVRTRATTNGS